MASRWARVGSGELGIMRSGERRADCRGVRRGWFRGGYGSRERAMRFARWNGRARSMMQRSCPQSLLTHDILSPFLVTKLMPQVLPEQSPICLSTTSNVNDGSNFLNFGELKKRQNFCNGLFEIYPLHCRCLVPYPGTWYLNYPGAWPLN